jgi:hypothetical protein
MGITKSFKDIEHLPVVHAARQKGLAIHKEIDHYLTCFAESNMECLHQPLNPIKHTPETKLFINWFEKTQSKDNPDMSPLLSEQILFTKEYMVAGRMDSGWREKDTGRYIIADYKTAKSVDLWATAWQLAIYKFMLIPFFRADQDFKLLVFSFDWDANKQKPYLKVDDVSTYVSNKEVVGFFEDYYAGKLYSKGDKILEPRQKELVVKASQLLENIKAQENTVKTLKDQLQEVKSKLYDVMANKNVKTLKIDIPDSTKEVSITRVDKFFRSSLDAARLKEEHPSIYAEYKKISEVDPTVRISVKEASDEEDSITSAISRF